MSRRREMEEGMLTPGVPTPNEVNDAADIIGEDLAWEMTGNKGFGGASVAELRAIVDAAKKQKGH